MLKFSVFRYDDSSLMITIVILLDKQMSEISSREEPHNRNELRQVQENVHMMRNRVQLLRSQLQKQKDSIKKHKSLTEDMVRKKVEISKLAALRNRDNGDVQSEISQLRERNHSFRQIHKKEMTNILKAVYLVKLDEARQMKSLSQQHKQVLHQRQQSLRAKQKQRRLDMAIQSEHAKQRYLQYWKHKLNSIYSASQNDKRELEAETEEQKQLLKKYQQEEIELLESINKLHLEQTDAKKEYLASLTLSNKEIQQAFEQKEEKKNKSKNKEKLSPRKERERQKEAEWEEKIEKLGGSRVDHKYKDHKDKDKDFWSKSPHMSIMSTNDMKIPRASVDPQKLKIILKELKRLQSLDNK